MKCTNKWKRFYTNIEIYIDFSALFSEQGNCLNMYLKQTNDNKICYKYGAQEKKQVEILY